MILRIVLFYSIFVFSKNILEHDWIAIVWFIVIFLIINLIELIEIKSFFLMDIAFHYFKLSVFCLSVAVSIHIHRYENTTTWWLLLLIYSINWIIGQILFERAIINRKVKL